MACIPKMIFMQNLRKNWKKCWKKVLIIIKKQMNSAPSAAHASSAQRPQTFWTPKQNLTHN